MLNNKFHKINYKKTLSALGLAGLMMISLTGCDKIKEKLEKKEAPAPQLDKDGNPLPPPPPPPKPINISTANAELQNVLIREQTIGEIQGEKPPAPITIQSVTSGVVEKVLSESSSKVVKGQLLMQIQVDNTLEFLKDDLKNNTERLRQVANENDNLARQYADARNRLGAVEREIANRTLLSSVAGNVTKRLIKEGEIVKANQAIFEITPEFKPEPKIKIALPFAKDSRVKADQMIVLNLRTNPDDKIEEKIRVVRPHGKYQTAYVEIPFNGKMEKDWRAGVAVAGDVKVVDRSNVVAIPAIAILKNDKKQLKVFVLPKGKTNVEERIVETGEKIGEKGDKIEITKGLKDGETVVTSNLDQLKIGTLVTVQEDAPK